MLNTSLVNITRLISSMPFYAVRYGRQTGVFKSWPECEKQVKGYNKPKFKKFPTETEAWDFVRCTGQYAGDTPSKFTSSPSPSKSVGPSGIQPVRLRQALNFDTDSMDDSDGTSTHVSTSYPQGGRTTNVATSYPQSGRNTTLLSLKSCVNNMKKTMDQMRQYVTQADAYIEELQASQKSAPSSFSSHNARASSSTATNEPNRKRQKVDDYNDPSLFAGEVDETAAVVYTDGACFNNGTPEAAAGIGVYWGPNNPMNLSQRLAGRQTNNRAEIHAAIRAIEQARQMGVSQLTLKTDSNFMIQSITKWIKKWKENGWILSTGNPVINRADFEELEEVMEGISIKWVHVRGHQGIEGNEAADRLANEGARMPPV